MKKGKNWNGEAGPSELPVVETRAAGIDIGSRELYVCGPAGANGQRETRSYPTTTVGIQQCTEWLKQQGVKTVAMESTGVYWIPVLEIMESGGLETLLVDTRPLSRVPGRKSDVNDCQWIQTLHSHGLLQGAYRPDEKVSQIRTLVRQKAVLVREQADWVRRIQKCLDQMNVRVHHAVKDLQGATGMAMIRAIVAGQRDPVELAKLRDPGCRHSAAEMVEYLTGHWRSDHLFNLKQSLTMYDAIGERIAAYEKEIQERMEEMTPGSRKSVDAPPLEKAEKRKAMKRRHQEAKRQTLYRMVGADLTTIDGIGVETAEVIISEYGVDLSKFETEGQFVSHVKLAPYRPKSGGKVLKKHAVRPKATRTAEALRNAASSLRSSTSALGAYYRRMARRTDGRIAVFATARKLATYVYRLLRWGQAYVDIGQEQFEQQYAALRYRTVATTADQLGYCLVKKELVTA